MSTQSMPQIPPRPMRSQDPDLSMAAEKAIGGDFPRIPPRPINRRADRSQSPNRAGYARSPLNDSFMPSSFGKAPIPASGNSNRSSVDLPRRPSAVTLPSLGQEGNEYEGAFGDPDDIASSLTQTRSVADDLHLHAPKPSLPVSSAKQRVSAVTRTDSSQAAAHGIGKSTSDDKDPHIRSLKAKSSFSSERSIGFERRASSSENADGGPEVGQRVPMYPNAGIVQAPSPSPYGSQFPAGIGFHNDGSKPRHHGRRTSGRGFEGPPGSYGLHGHGITPKDRFEQAYYEKHPELLKKETGHYSGAVGDGRGEWAMSSEDLNKIVRDTALGMSSSFGTPHEEIGFLASEEYISRKSSPLPSPLDSVTHLHGPQTHVDSPLRKASFPTESSSHAELHKAVLKQSMAVPPPEAALESEAEDDGVVHVDHPARRASKIYGGAGIESTENLSPYPGSTVDEGDNHHYSAPILAADEVAKDPFGHELQPAVSPMHQERRSSGHDNEHFYNLRAGSQSSLPGSKASSRPTSIHGVIPGFHHERESLSTPLEDLEEYEPLFPEDGNPGTSPRKVVSAADKLKKRPDLQNRRFPSQDVWEDAPNSVHYTATVSTPQAPEEKEELSPKGLDIRAGETPGQAFARRQEELAEAESFDTESFLNREKKPWAHNASLIAEKRPDLKQRFPSRDIWEDSPDSLHLQTTVSAPQTDEWELMSPPDERPTQEKSAADLPLGPEEGRATTGIAATMKPQIPTRPVKKNSLDDVLSQSPPAVLTLAGVKPTVTERPKPQVPARPVKLNSREPSDDAPLTKTISGSSAKSVGSDSGVAAKPKPPVPSRPVGSKIAALQGGFMSDLNKRLQLGPKAPKKEEPVPEEVSQETEKAPLADARKGRARGPARRAPAKSPTPAVEAAPSAGGLSFSSPSTLWHIHPDDGALNVASHEAPAVVPETKAAQPESSVAKATTSHEAEVASSSNHPAKDSPTVQHADSSEAAEADALDDENYEHLSGSTATLKPIRETVDDVPHLSKVVESENGEETQKIAAEGVEEEK